MMNKSIQTELIIINKLGLHARAAAKLKATAAKYSSTIKVGVKVGEFVDAKSVMSLMLLAASNGTTLHFDIRGNDAQDAYRALESLISNKFGEKE